MKYYGTKDKYWGIDYIVDINEIIIHFGKKNSKGKVITIYDGYDGDEGYIEMEKRIKKKLKTNYKKISKSYDSNKLYEERILNK